MRLARFIEGISCSYTSKTKPTWAYTEGIWVSSVTEWEPFKEPKVTVTSKDNDNSLKKCVDNPKKWRCKNRLSFKNNCIQFWGWRNTTLRKCCLSKEGRILGMKEKSYLHMALERTTVNKCVGNATNRGMACIRTIYNNMYWYLLKKVSLLLLYLSSSTSRSSNSKIKRSHVVVHVVVVASSIWLSRLSARPLVSATRARGMLVTPMPPTLSNCSKMRVL